MDKAKYRRGKGVDVRRVLTRAKEFIHPSNVSWKKPKDTTHDSMVVLGVVAVSAIFLLAGDALFGLIMGLLF